MTRRSLALCCSILSLALAAHAEPPSLPDEATFSADLGALLSRLGGSEALTARSKDRVRHHLAALLLKPTLRETWARKTERWPTIQRALADAALPPDFGYMAWAESGFRSEAVSPVGSRGVWQFLPATAQRSGLRVDAEVDERLDFDKETRAAARHLVELIGVFGKDSPLLAMAAYNAGQKQMKAVVEAAGSRDFFHLYEQGAVPAEAGEYVHRILAAALIGANPQRYGLQ
jgi:membrane-bound lytic murein transglycosylase D